MEINNSKYADYIDDMQDDVSDTLEHGHKWKKHYVSDLKISDRAKMVIADMDAFSNHSFGIEVFLRNKKNLDKTAIMYRGNKITYRELLSKVYAYAKSLKAMGYEEGSEVPVCASNMPEFVYLFLAVNLIGAKLNSFGEWFDKDYTKFILENSKSKTVFVSDDVYDMIKDKVGATNLNNIVVLSLSDSLKNGNVYSEIDEKFHPGLFDSKFSAIKAESDKKVISSSEFEMFGKDYDGKVVADTELDTPAVITYTSGTTNPGVPKGVLHNNRSYATIARFKDRDITNLTNMDGIKSLLHIPTYTHMELCSMMDALYHGCTLCLEPVYDKDFFKYSVIMHRANYQPGSQAFNYELCNALENDEEFRRLCDGLAGTGYRNGQLGELIAPTITGEGMDKGSEKYFNKVARKHKFGVSKLHFPSCYSIGGGTGEASGVFTTLFKGYMEKMPPNVFYKDSLGLNTLPFVEVVVLDENGDYCKDDEPGVIGVKSPCDMAGYYYTEKDFPKLHIDSPYMEASDGRKFLKMSNVAVKTKTGSIKIKDRLNNNILLSDGTSIPCYEVCDAILSDTKNIMTGSLVKINDDIIGEAYVMHVMFQPGVSDMKKVLKGISKRLASKFPQELLDKLYIRVRSFEEGFPVAPSGKRDVHPLINEGYTSKCESVTNLLYVYFDRKGKVLKK